jgi:hypothetical protein
MSVGWEGGRRNDLKSVVLDRASGGGDARNCVCVVGRHSDRAHSPFATGRARTRVARRVRRRCGAAERGSGPRDCVCMKQLARPACRERSASTTERADSAHECVSSDQRAEDCVSSGGQRVTWKARRPVALVRVARVRLITRRRSASTCPSIGWRIRRAAGRRRAGPSSRGHTRI